MRSGRRTEKYRKNNSRFFLQIFIGNAPSTMEERDTKGKLKGRKIEANKENKELKKE
jgi:hypothetical protein